MIKDDSLIRLFAYHQILRKGDTVNFEEKNQIRQKLRFLGRLLHRLQTSTKQRHSFKNFLKPEYYDAFVQAALHFRKDNKQMAFTLGHYIRKLCLLNISECIKSKDSDMKADTQDFLDLFQGSWSETVSSSTIRMQQKAKITKQVSLPTTDDLLKLTRYIESEISRDVESLTCEYTRLQKLVLAQLILFNKRRPAEVANLTVDAYQLSLDNQEDREEIIQTLSPEEKAVAQR